MQITGLVRQKKAKSRYNVYLNNEYAFSAFEGTVIQYSLFVDKEILEDEVEKIQAYDKYVKCYNSAIDIISRRMHAEKELYFKLRKRFENQEIVQVLKRLKELKYLDDSQFSKLWVESRSRSRGVNLLIRELKLKGVDKDIIERTITDQLISDDLELEKTIELVRKKFKNIENFTNEDKYKKIASFLSRRGFPYSIISRTHNYFK